ncbi:MAG: DUF1127 domain-containing protein [Pseudomonadota bacterium]
MFARSSALFRPFRPTRRPNGIVATVFCYLSLYRQRRELLDMPQHLLDDIGITRREAEEEARRSIWDAPSHWQR